MTPIASHYADTSPPVARAKPRPSYLAEQLQGGSTAVRILDVVAERFGVTWEEILSKAPGARERHRANARHVAAWFMRRAGMSYPAIGRAIGGRDQQTAMHAVRKIGRERADDESVRRYLDAMGAELDQATGASRGPMSSSGSNEERGQ